MISLRDATHEDIPTIVTLNEEVVAVTSPMDAGRFKELWELSSHCIVAEKDGAVIGFVLAMQKGAAYENGNYNWFSDRLSNFVYIDRIVVSKAGQGHGLGGKLYHHVAEAAKKDGCLVMSAEIDLVPPNEQSLKFHEKDGFVKLGARGLESGKLVSMQIKGL
jgi:predicted GNAT superfamily acetyltransferase